MVNIPCFVHQNGLSVDGLSTLPPCPPDCHPGGQTAYLRGPVHQNGLSVDGLSTLPPCPPDCHPGGQTAYLRGPVHQNGLTVDKQLIFGALSTKTASRWTNSLSSGPCPRKRPHGGQTAMRTRLLHPARTLVLSLALATDIGAESSAVFNQNKKNEPGAI